MPNVEALRKLIMEAKAKGVDESTIAAVQKDGLTNKEKDMMLVGNYANKINDILQTAAAEIEEILGDDLVSLITEKPNAEAVIRFNGDVSQQVAFRLGHHCKVKAGRVGYFPTPDKK